MFQHIAHEIDFALLSQDDELASIVQLIQHHEREILELRKRLNSLLPIARGVPDDILVEIFSHSIWLARHPEWEYNRKYGVESEESPEDPRWWPVPLVCQRWRELVMTHPRLWSFISLRDRPEYVHRAIERSGNAGLQLRLFSPGFHSWSHNPAIFQELLGLLPRAYMLEYRFKSYPTKEDNRMHTLGSLPRIQTLYLWGTGDSSFGKGEVQADPLAQSLVAAPLPRLETLIMANTPRYLLDILKHATITSLEINNGIEVERYGLDLGSLMDGLACLSLLRVLRLRVSSLLDERHDSSELKRVMVQFPHLQELKLDTGTESCLRLLSSISFGPQTNVYIFATGALNHPASSMECGPVELIAQIMERLKVLQFGHWSPPYRLTLGEEEHRAYTKRGFMSVNNHTARISSQSGHTLDFQELQNSADGRNCVIEHLPLQGIETIEFQNLYHILGGRRWASSGDADMTLHWSRTITASSLVYSGSSHSCDNFLQSFGDLKPPSHHPRCPLPQVKSLTLVGVDNPQHLFERLRTTLDTRRTGGVPIEELVWRQNEDQEPKFTRTTEATLLETLQDVDVKVTLDLPVSG